MFLHAFISETVAIGFPERLTGTVHVCCMYQPWISVKDCSEMVRHSSLHMEVGLAVMTRRGGSGCVKPAFHVLDALLQLVS